MTLSSTIRVAALIAAAGAASAHAQVLAVPPRLAPAPTPARTTGGLFGGRRPIDPRIAQQQLALSMNMLVGHDDNLSPEPNAAPGPFQQRRSGQTLTGSTDLSYSRTRGTTVLAASFRGYLNQFANIGIRPLLGAEGNVSAAKRVWGRTLLSGNLLSGYRPTFSVGATGGAVTTVGTVESAPGFAEVRSVNSGGQGSITQEWSTRHRTAFTAAGAQTTFQGGALTLATNSRFASGTLSHSWDFTANMALQTGYSYSDIVTESVGAEDRRPAQTQIVSAGLAYRLAISRTRSANFSAGPAVTIVRTTSTVGDAPIEYSAPSGYASVRVDLGRTWALSSAWRRETSVLDGLAQQTFLTNSFSVSLGGAVRQRTSFTVSSSILNGAPHRGDTGSFASQMSIAQLQYNLTRCCSLLGNYSYGRHEVRDVAIVPAGFPRQFERNAVRIGMSVRLPLYGTFPVVDRRDARRVN
jgi:hypothetical protein